MRTKCTYERSTGLCVEHSGHYFGGRDCSERPKGDRLDARIAKLISKREVKIARLTAQRNDMRTFWKRTP
jgi:hypothetical protein